MFPQSCKAHNNLRCVTFGFCRDPKLWLKHTLCGYALVGKRGEGGGGNGEGPFHSPLVFNFPGEEGVYVITYLFFPVVLNVGYTLKSSEDFYKLEYLSQLHPKTSELRMPTSMLLKHP